MKRRHGIREYWATLAYRIGERLRAGESEFYARDFRSTRSVRTVAGEFGLVADRYAVFRPGAGTYAAIERHIERTQRARNQLRLGLFPHGLAHLNSKTQRWRARQAVA